MLSTAKCGEFWGGRVPVDGILGHYRLVSVLGRGGMGQVWLAEDTRLGREVALKVLPPELAVDEEYRRRFEREARLAVKLRGPHVVPIHSFGELDGRLYIEMERVDGEDLGKILHRHGALTPERAVDLVAQVAEALDVAHAAGLVHRDVKPSNVLTLPSGFAYLIDFGIARGGGQAAITSTGVAVGTWAYMAPERFSGEEDLRSDVYSLACLLFECLTGELPFGQTGPAQQMAAHLTAPPPRASVGHPQVPVALDGVIARGMAKHPPHRYASAGELATAARAALNGQSGSAVGSSAPPTVKWDGGVPYPQPVPTHGAPGPLSYPPRQSYSSTPAVYTPVPQSYSPLTPPPLVVAGPAPFAAYPTPMPDGQQRYAPIGPQPAQVRWWQPIWWTLLALLVLLFGAMTIGGVAVAVSGGYTVADMIAAFVLFFLPFVGFGYLAIREVRKFRAAQRG
ncbi:protein kinase [Nocardia yamanashiensis]|uniref:serine/threonine-protein kinase n=1 Tax=Nocardia yamanashiensis TaxID=209247 RepID=UPI001E64ABC5|nr:serine/threonine-protein kinase [Nocardia yamanashiensis]UGT39789.1 protein kinase [Nocardia yamanashiensis]